MNFDNDDFGLDDLSDEEKEKERYIRNHPPFQKSTRDFNPR
jgi:hypothetical protein